MLAPHPLKSYYIKIKSVLGPLHTKNPLSGFEPDTQETEKSGCWISHLDQIDIK